MNRWKTRRLVGLGVCCCLLGFLLAGGALAQSTGPYQVAGGLISGGDYRLTTADWHVSGAASGEGYHLLAPAAPMWSGSGCCCSYLPCVMRAW